MDTDNIVQNMEEYVQSFRSLFEKRRLSELAPKVEQAKMALGNLKALVLDNTTVRSAVQNMQEHVEDFEQAVKKGDKELTAKALILMEEAVQELRRKRKA